MQLFSCIVINCINILLDERITLVAEHNTDPFHWWCDHKRQFPILSELARMFLIIPTTSVPSERLFSDAGNNMTNKRTTISPKIFKECIFLKRNNCIINSFK